MNIYAALRKDKNVLEDSCSRHKDYIVLFNEKRPAYSLKYLTPKQYKDVYYQNSENKN